MLALQIGFPTKKKRCYCLVRRKKCLFSSFVTIFFVCTKLVSKRKNINRRDFVRAIPALISFPFFLRQGLISGNYFFSSFDENIETKDELILLEKMKYAETHNLYHKPINEVIIAIAKTFLNAKYEINPIESEGDEQLVVNLRGFDCVTFCEASLVIARCIKRKDYTFKDFKSQLKFVRYRNGHIDGYPSRLHYTTDYFYDGQRKGILKDITKQLGGVLWNKEVNYMSKNPDSYPKLKKSQKFISEIQKIEKEISKRKIYHIPKSKVGSAVSKIKNGDILGITTDIVGLDCSHTGIAIWEKKQLRMIHASSSAKKVQITENSLQEYLENNKSNLGIIIARPKEIDKNIIDC